MTVERSANFSVGKYQKRADRGVISCIQQKSDDWWEENRTYA